MIATSSQKNGQTGYSIMPIADHNACSTIG